MKPLADLAIVRQSAVCFPALSGCLSPATGEDYPKISGNQILLHPSYGYESASCCWAWLGSGLCTCRLRRRPPLVRSRDAPGGRGRENIELIETNNGVTYEKNDEERHNAKCHGSPLGPMPGGGANHAGQYVGVGAGRSGWRIRANQPDLRPARSSTITGYQPGERLGHIL